MLSTTPTPQPEAVNLHDHFARRTWVAPPKQNAEAKMPPPLPSSVSLTASYQFAPPVALVLMPALMLATHTYRQLSTPFPPTPSHNAASAIRIGIPRPQLPGFHQIPPLLPIWTSCLRTSCLGPPRPLWSAMRPDVCAMLRTSVEDCLHATRNMHQAHEPPPPPPHCHHHAHPCCLRMPLQRAVCHT